MKHKKLIGALILFLIIVNISVIFEPNQLIGNFHYRLAMEAEADNNKKVAIRESISAITYNPISIQHFKLLGRLVIGKAPIVTSKEQPQATP